MSSRTVGRFTYYYSHLQNIFQEFSHSVNNLGGYENNLFSHYSTLITGDKYRKTNFIRNPRQHLPRAAAKEK